MNPTREIRRISPQELHRKLDDGKPFYLIDTLPNNHFQKIHLPKSNNACVYEVTFIDQVKSIAEKDADIVLVGASSRSLDSLVAMEKLAREGYAWLSVLEGGIEAWRAAGYFLEGEAVSAPDDPQTRLDLEDRTYRVDTERSTIEWAGRNPSTTHFGHVGLSAGNLAVKAGAITGTFEIDMNSITNKNLEGDELQPVLVSHLRSDDFFLVKLFPTARFEILNCRPVRDPFLTTPNIEINGTLNLRGIKAGLDFMATVNKTPENGLTAEAHFDIDRTRWQILYGSTRFFEHLGMHVVFDLISFQLRIFAD